MELKIKVNEIIIKDKQSGKEHLVRTVQTAEEIYELVDSQEREALEGKVYDLADYR